MRVWMLGTGTPVPNHSPNETAFAVEVEGSVLVVDCGYGTTQQYLRAGLDPRSLSHVALTHHHYDHNADYPHLVLSTWVMGRSTPLRVYGPAGTRRASDLLFGTIYAEDVADRSTLGRPAEGSRVEARDLEPGAQVEDGPWRLSALRVVHGRMTALGYRIEAAGRRIVFSGDTVPVPEVAEAARGADLLVHEVHFAPGVRLPADERRVVEGRHSLPRDVAALAEAAGVRRLAVNHFFPLGEDGRERLAAELAAYRGELIIGRDLLAIDL